MTLSRVCWYLQFSFEMKEIEKWNKDRFWFFLIFLTGKQSDRQSALHLLCSVDDPSQRRRIHCGLESNSSDGSPIGEQLNLILWQYKTSQSVRSQLCPTDQQWHFHIHATSESGGRIQSTQFEQFEIHSVHSAQFQPPQQFDVQRRDPVARQRHTQSHPVDTGGLQGAQGFGRSKCHDQMFRSQRPAHVTSAAGNVQLSRTLFPGLEGCSAPRCLLEHRCQILLCQECARSRRFLPTVGMERFPINSFDTFR